MEKREARKVKSKKKELQEGKSKGKKRKKGKNTQSNNEMIVSRQRKKITTIRTEKTRKKLSGG